MTEIDAREVAEAEAWKRVDLIRQDAGFADHDATWWATGFEAGAQWAVEQLPSRDEIASQIAESSAYGFRWEQIQPMTRAAYLSAADAVLTIIRERYEGES